ncbi:hypothetical protein [Salipiger abyssi]|uniref:hypothetical protein n=1 Tax=Salipiger abyssi TaxID=1250539 RepID=UPI004059D2E8
MTIVLHPQGRNEPLGLTKAGDELTLNGEAVDFAVLPDGATLPADAISSDWITGKVERGEAGELIVPLALPHPRPPVSRSRLRMCPTARSRYRSTTTPQRSLSHEQYRPDQDHHRRGQDGG